MLPFAEQDLAGSFAHGRSRWAGLSMNELIPYLSDIEALFGLPEDGYGAPDAPALSGFSARRAKWPPFSRRNVAELLRRDIESAEGPEIWINATVVDLELAEGGRISSVAAKASSGAKISVRAAAVVIAAGAIESTRLLLALDRKHGGQLFGDAHVLGRGFHDHVSAKVADVSPLTRIEFNALFGFRFQGGAMRNLRYEHFRAASGGGDTPAGFAHVASIGGESSGFAALREIYRKAQRKELPAVRDLMQLAGGAPWLARAVWARYARKRLRFPDDAIFELHLVTEQIPHPDNRITLSISRKDVFGVPLAEIDWRVREADLTGHARLFKKFVQAWRVSALSGIAELRPLSQDVIAASLEAGSGVYHPGGSTRIGVTDAEGVVDRDLRLFRVPNLWVIATSAFPMGGAANPTMTLALLAYRAADRIHRSV